MQQVEKQQIAMKAVIVRNGKILILREAQHYADGTNTGRYQLPGGRVEMGESWQEALQREIRQETGLLISSHHPLFVGEWMANIRSVRHQIIAVFFVCTVNDGEVILSAEHDASCWITAESYQEYDLLEPEPDVIRAYLSSEFA